VLGVSARGSSCSTGVFEAFSSQEYRDGAAAVEWAARQPWSTADVRMLRQLAKGNTPTGVMSVKLQRPIAAIRSKAHREGISLRPVNRSPYNRRATKTRAAKRR